MGQAGAKKSPQEWLGEWRKGYPELWEVDGCFWDPRPISRDEFHELLTFHMSEKRTHQAEKEGL